MNVIVLEAASAPHLARLHASAMARPWDEAAFAKLLASPGVSALGAMQKNTLLGFVLLRVAADEAEILTLAVAPGAQRRGVGTELLREAQATARKEGAQDLFLEVAEDNALALALYRKAGFMPVGRRKAYYGDRDAVLMRLTVKD